MTDRPTDRHRQTSSKTLDMICEGKLFTFCSNILNVFGVFFGQFLSFFFSIFYNILLRVLNKMFSLGNVRKTDSYMIRRNVNCWPRHIV